MLKVQVRVEIDMTEGVYDPDISLWNQNYQVGRADISLGRWAIRWG